ncbi:MAG: hypothetical protein GXN92_01500 [Candidatus Micrarchaeota archaeon]|nr:hypothetical protein [Candidatus Micrarchaeota archaeon]
MPTTLKKKEEVKKVLTLERDTKVDLKLKKKFMPAQIRTALQKLGMFYGTDDRIGFVIKLMQKGLKDKSYHKAIVSELESLKKDLERFLEEPEANKQLLKRTIEAIENLLNAQYPQYYEEVIDYLRKLRVAMFKIEDSYLIRLNDQLKRLIDEFPELYPDVPIEYDYKDEEKALAWSLEEFGEMFEIGYDLMIALEGGDSHKAREALKKLNKLVRVEPSEDEKDILGYAKYIITLFMDSRGREVIKAKEVIKISVVFQLLVRYFVIRFRIEYPGDSERVNARLSYHKS